MYNTQGFIGRKVLCLENSSIVGEVKAVLFGADGKQVFYLALSRDGGATLLPFDKIESAKDAIVIGTEAVLAYDYDVDMTSLRFLDGKEIYSQTGEKKGVVDGVELFANGKTNKIFAGDLIYSPSVFQAFGDILLLKPAKKRIAKPRIPRDKTDRKVEILARPADSEQHSFVADLSDKEAKAGARESNPDVDAGKNTAEVFAIEPAEPKPPAFIEQGSPLFSQDALEKKVNKGVI